MGTGKTAVGKKLASDLKMRFVEMDSIIEEREGKKINEIFSEKGEPYFRESERKLVKELSGMDKLVISTGGGVVLNPENIENFGRNGILVCLTAAPEEIYKRVKDEKHRPLLNIKNPLEKIKELLDYRKPFYNKIDIQIDTGGRTVEDVAGEIRVYYEKNKSQSR